MNELAELRRKLRLAREWERLTFTHQKQWPGPAATERWVLAQRETVVALDALKQARLAVPVEPA